ncbi:hypothetical protein ANN_13530 [Periplaneta americana]|uniref:Endonuclease/exonuclease/phosphatase domain-containing protein n=1 Tax=Periplaneta americana TaxID=6978 RepID=A0ABQ8TK34_PERAM|nr:hypothetical protein ANN_13530 [Periplaneta americana]
MGESRNAYRVLVGRPEGKRPSGRPRRRWEDNIKMDLREVGYDDRDWINLTQDRDLLRAYVRAAMKLRNVYFGAKRDEVTGEWRKLHNAELHALYSSPDIIRNIKSTRVRWAGHVARMGESRNAYRVLLGRQEEKRPLGRPRRRWEDNIKMDLREVGYDGRDWINLAQDRDQWRAYVRAAVNLRGRWCDIIVINAHAPTEEKDDHIKDSFYEELEHTFDQLPRYHMKVLLGDLNAKVGQEDIFKPTIGKESLHVSSNDNGVRPLAEQVLNVNRGRLHATVSPYSQKEKKNNVLYCNTYLARFSPRHH